MNSLRNTSIIQYSKQKKPERNQSSPVSLYGKNDFVTFCAKQLHCFHKIAFSDKIWYAEINSDTTDRVCREVRYELQCVMGGIQAQACRYPTLFADKDRLKARGTVRAGFYHPVFRAADARLCRDSDLRVCRFGLSDPDLAQI